MCDEQFGCLKVESEIAFSVGSQTSLGYSLFFCLQYSTNVTTNASSRIPVVTPRTMAATEKERTFRTRSRGLSGF